MTRHRHDQHYSEHDDYTFPFVRERKLAREKRRLRAKMRRNGAGWQAADSDHNGLSSE